MVGHLLEDILTAFPRHWILTPDERAAYPGDEWPSQLQVSARPVWGLGGGRVGTRREV